MNYCQDARELLGISVICGSQCPIFSNCPRLLLEDATDQAIEKAIRSMVKIIRRGNEDSKGKMGG